MSLQYTRLAAAIASLPLTALGAQTTLEPVVVTAEQEAASASIVNQADIEALKPATSDAASLLRYVPGVSLYGAGGVSSLPAIHGLADDRLRIKVDGMDLISSCPNHMNPPLSYLDPSQVGSLKVYAGISPVSLGGDSIGGTIIAESPVPEFAAPGGTLAKWEIGGFYRDNSDAFGGNLSATYATDRMNFTYRGAVSEADNYTAGGDFKTSSATGRAGHTLPLDEVGSSAYQTSNHTLGFALKNPNHLTEARIGYQVIPFQNYPNQRMDMLDNTQYRLSVGDIGKYAWGKLDARAYYETVDHFMDFGDDKRYWYGMASGGPMMSAGMACSPIGPKCAAGMPMYTESENLGAVAKAEVDLSPRDSVTFGGELQSYHLDDYWPASGAGMWPGTFLNINDGNRDRAAVFAEWEGRWNPQWKTLLGARYERVMMDTGEVRGYSTDPSNPSSQVSDASAFNAQNRERNDDNLNLTALARYTRDAGMDVEFGLARKVRSPNLYERYAWSTWSMAAVMNNFVGDGNGYIGNLDLEPETAHNLSATFDWHAPDRSWEFKATPYYSLVDDYIDAVRCTKGASCTLDNATTTNKFVVLQYANQSARLYGLDLSGHMPLAKTAVGDLGLKGVFGYTKGENRDTGDGLYNIMPLNAKLTLTHQYGGWDNAVELVVVDAKDDVSDVRNEIQTPGYGIVNLRSGYDWKQARFDIGVENLFDKLYFDPLGGAYVGQGRTMGINAVPWGIAVPGRGLTLYAGVKVKF